MANKVCVYAISKNEEQFVERWYESMKEADYIIVVDTGSTDHTVEKLRELGVTVYEEIINPWRFDVARNASLDHVPEDANILVSTDLDEVLEPGWAAILREEWIEGFHTRAVYKYSWSHLPNGKSGRVFQYDKIHDRNWRWKYPVHELLWNEETQTNSYQLSNTLNLFDRVHLHHYPDETKSRGSYLPLLELRKKENPDDLYGLIYLGHEYCYRQKYDECINTLFDALLLHRHQMNTIEQASCYLFIGDAYHEQQNNREAINNYLKAISIEPGYREPYLNIAKVFIEEEQYEQAILYAKLALTLSYRHYTWLERDISWTYEPYDILCLAAFYAGHKKDSIVYAAKALSYDDTNQRLIDNFEKCVLLTDDKELI